MTDDAIFDGVGVQTVRWDGAVLGIWQSATGSGASVVTNQGLRVENGDVTIRSDTLTAYEYSITGLASIINGGRLRIGLTDRPMVLDIGSYTDIDTGGTLDVTGINSAWNSSGDLGVGGSGPGTLNVEAGGTVTNNVGYIAVAADSTGTATVTGPDSQWNSSGLLKVGDAGSGDLTVEAGGVVSNADGFIGDDAGSMGTVTVSGEGSQWNNSSHVRVGGEGSGDLTVEAGGVVTHNIGYVGFATGSTGTATVTGPGSQWNSNRLFVGGSGSGALTVAAGGVVSNDEGRIGSGSTSVGTATVTGPGSQWNNSESLWVGFAGSGALTVEDGGVVTSGFGAIGDLGTSSTGTVTVTGPGSQWNNSEFLSVGADGRGDLTIEAGGVVSNTDGSIGSMSTATVTGSGSQWNNSAALYVGFGLGGDLTVADGGVVSNTDGFIGDTADSTGTATVTGPGSQWNSSNNLYVGGNGSASGGTGTLNVNLGGTINVTHALTIWDAGTVHLNGGTVNTGDVAMAGGPVTNHGLLTGSGRVSATLDNSAAGEVAVMAGDTLHFAAAGNTNAGEINLLGGTARFDQTLTNEAGGFIGGRGALIADDGFTNEGAVAFTGTADVFGDVSNSGGGQIATSGGATLTLYDDVVHNGAEIRASSGAAVVFLGSLSGAGPLTGGGDFFLEGDFRPGNSPDLLEVTGDVTFGSLLLSEFELGGLTRGTEYDAVNVAGTLALAGTLKVVLFDLGGGLFAPSAGDSFNLLDATSLLGSFTAFDLPALAGGLVWDTSLLNISGDLGVAAVPLPAGVWLLLSALLGLVTVSRRWGVRFRQSP